jgi:hypothetical protein
MLDATVAAITVDQATAKLVDGTTIMATDLVVIAGPKMVHTSTDGEPAAGAELDIILPRSVSCRWWDARHGGEGHAGPIGWRGH